MLPLYNLCRYKAPEGSSKGTKLVKEKIHNSYDIKGRLHESSQRRNEIKV